MSTSPTSGALRIVLGPSPSIAATMCLVTAFFDPRTAMSPRSGPDGSTCQVSVTLTTVGALPARLGAVHLTVRPSAGSTGPASATWPGGAPDGVATRSRSLRQGCFVATSQYPRPASSTAPMIQPSGYVGTPT